MKKRTRATVSIIIGLAFLSQIIIAPVALAKKNNKSIRQTKNITGGKEKFINSESCNQPAQSLPNSNGYLFNATKQLSKQSLLSPQWKSTIGKYFIRIEKDGPHYVGGCIQKNIAHFHFHIRNIQSNQDIINLHVTGWKDAKKKPCIGLYNSASGWSYCSCKADNDKLKDMLYSALLAVGFSSAVSWLLTATAVPILAPAIGL